MLCPSCREPLRDGATLCRCGLVVPQASTFVCGEAEAGAPAPEARTTGRRELFVGRERELGELEAGLADARAGRGRLYVISGEAGSGKTRLASELATRARASGMRVLWGRCWESGGAAAFWPWIQVLRAWLHDGGGDGLAASQLGPGAAHLVRLVPELGRLAGAPRATPAVESELDRFHLFEAIATLLADAARERPLVVALDDLHAADRPSLLLLEFVARVAPESPLVLLGTYRDGELRSDPERTAMLGALVSLGRRLPLTGLATPDVARLAQHVLGTEPSRTLAARLRDATDGNPFFVDEVLRLWLADGQMHDGGAVAATQLRIPQGVREAILRRLAPLPRGDVALLALVSVAGRRFDLAWVEHVAQRPLARVLDVLGHATRAGIVVEDAPGRWAFSHALVREVLYDGLPPRDRLRLHRRMGELLEARYRADPGPHVAELAHHFAHAAQPGDVARALDWTVRAAEQAFGDLAYEEAAARYARAVDLLALGPPDDRRRCELLIALGASQDRAGDGARAQETFQAAIATARRLGAFDLLARAAVGFGGERARKFTSAMTDRSSVPVLEEALASLPAKDGVLRARVSSRLALRLRFENSRRRARVLAQQAVAMARRVGDLATLADTLIAEHAVLLDPDHLQSRLASAEELLRLGEAAGDAQLVLRAHALRIIDLHESGDGAAAADAIAIHAHLADVARDPFERWISAAYRASSAHAAGELADAERWNDAGLAIARNARGLPSARENADMSHAVQLFLARREQGRLDEILPMVRTYADTFPKFPGWRVVHALSLVELGRAEQARAVLDRLAARRFAGIPRDSAWLGAIAFLADVVSALGDRARAAILYRLLAPYADRMAALSSAGWLGSLARPLGRLAATIGDRRGAIASLERAIERSARAGAGLWVARARFDLASVLADGDARDRERARALLATVGEAADARGLVRLAADARSLAGRLGAPPPAIALVGPQVRGEDEGLGPQLRREDAGPRVEHEDGLLRFEGDYWALGFAGHVVRVRGLKGMAYLACLLREPDREFHALELVERVHGVDGDGAVREAPVALIARGPELTFRRPGDAGPLIDGRARAAYGRRLDELRGELDEATRFGDEGRAERLGGEIDALTDELARAIGGGGRTRRAGSAAERARLSVRRALKTVLERVTELHPSLGRHLVRTVRTGTFCSYAPDPRVRLAWRIDTGRAATALTSGRA